MSYKTEVKFVQGLNQEITFHIGKSASGNFEIIDNADEDDLWFHVDNESSCHVIASIPENMDRKDIRYIVKQGAILCKQNSRFKTKTNIIYAKVKNVEKTNIPGKVVVSEEKMVSV
jgi:hypothetical protein